MTKLLVLVAVFLLVGLYATPADAVTGFVTESYFRTFDPFAVDVYVQFINDILNPTYLGYLSYYTYDPTFFVQGGFPLMNSIVSTITPGGTIYTEYNYGYTFNGQDHIAAGGFSLPGIAFQNPFNAMGFFLADTIDHDNRGVYQGTGEYITRAVRNYSGYVSFFNYGFRGVNDVFIGYINDVTGFRALWAGWYRDKYGNVNTRSVEYLGNVNSFSHMLAPAAYVGTGGDPHMISRSTSSEMVGMHAGDILNLVDSAHVSVNAAIREFSFLPESMRENNYFGTVAAQLASGDRVLVTAFEAEEDVPAFSVSVNDRELEEGDVLDQEAFRVQYDVYERLDGAHGRSWFEEQFPFQQHHAIVRVWVYNELVVDVSLTTKDHFVDWHNAEPVVHQRTGAFLNINMRDLRQDAATAGLLRDVDSVHKRKLMRQRAIEAGQQLEERDIDVDFESVVRNVVDAHRVGSLF